MAAQGIIEGGAPMRHVVRVDWFQRDPGGSTTFVMPAGVDGATPRQAIEHDNGVSSIDR